MKKFRHFFLFVRTIRYLKGKQIIYQVYYRVLKRIFPDYFIYSSQASPLPFYFILPALQNSPSPALVRHALAISGNKFIFSFLNVTHAFSERVNWNFSDNGKLWTYNLNYFEFLFSPACTRETGIRLIHDYIAGLYACRDGMEPYPVSLRNMNWIKFMVAHDIHDPAIAEAICRQYELLEKRPEYHLMGNHLLENGFSLLFGGYFLNDRRFYETGKKIISEELTRQILPDGGHFEQSPMYHQIILHRLLDSINLMANNRQLFYSAAFEDMLRGKAKKMLRWMNTLCFSDGSFPCFNDASAHIAAEAEQLIAYAGKLEISSAGACVLKESGYRMWKKKEIECSFDISNITASYQPGHTHADTFTFCLHAFGKPVLVDTGISTYTRGERRQIERSTQAHNTVEVEGRNSSEVWGVFRLGKRAEVEIVEEKENRIVARHNGYRALECIHQRTFDWIRDELMIRDELLNGHDRKGMSYLHFHPDCQVSLQGNRIIAGGLQILLNGFQDIVLESYYFCAKFNQLVPAVRMKGAFIGISEIKTKLMNPDRIIETHPGRTFGINLY